LLTALLFPQVAEIEALRTERDDQRRAISALQARLIAAKASNDSLQQRFLDLERLLVQSILGYSPDAATANLAMQQSLSPAAAHPQQLALGAIESALASLTAGHAAGGLCQDGMGGVHFGTHPAAAAALAAAAAAGHSSSAQFLQSPEALLTTGPAAVATPNGEHAGLLPLPGSPNAPAPRLLVHRPRAAGLAAAMVRGVERAMDADGASERDARTLPPQLWQPQLPAEQPPALQVPAEQLPALSPREAMLQQPVQAVQAALIAQGMHAAAVPLGASAVLPACSLAAAPVADKPPDKPANMLELLCSVAHSQDADVGYSTQADDASSTTSSRDGKEGFARDVFPSPAPVAPDRSAGVANDLLSKALAGQLGAAGSLARIRQQSSMAAGSMGQLGGGAIGGGGWVKRQKSSHS
jgi:hypothetical protein